MNDIKILETEIEVLLKNECFQSMVELNYAAVEIQVELEKLVHLNKGEKKAKVLIFHHICSF